MPEEAGATGQSRLIMARARSDVTDMTQDIVNALQLVRGQLDLGQPQTEAAWAQIETFAAIALRVFAKTNPSKLRDAAMAEEIKARIQGREVLE